MENVVIEKNKNSKTLVNKMFFNIFFIMLFMAFTTEIISLTDGLCISKFIGDDGTAGFSSISPINHLIVTLCETFAIGTQITVTSLLGKGKTRSAKSTFTIGFITSVSIGLLFAILCSSCCKFIATMLKTQEAGPFVYENCYKYILGLSFGFPFLYLNEMLIPIIQLNGKKKAINISIITTLVINVGLDVLFANIIPLENKILFIGLASSISYFASSVILFIAFWFGKGNIKFKFKEMKMSELKEIVINGLPILIKNIVITARSFILNYIMINIGGAIALTAHGAERVISGLFDTPVSALFSTVLLLSGVYFAEEDEISLNQLLKLIYLYLFTYTLSMTIVYFTLSPQIASIYGIGPEAFDETVYALRAASICGFFGPLNITILALLQTSKQQKFAYIQTTMQSLILPLIFILIFAYTIGTHGIWIGLTSGFAGYVFIHYIVAWIKAKKFPKDIRSILFLPKTFGYNKDDSIELDINNINDALLVAEKTREFCDKKNIDKRRKEVLAGCIEELAIIEVLSGFSKDLKNKHHCSIRILYKNNDLILRLRDDCPKIDINVLNDKLNQDDPTKNISIKILMNLAKDFKYNNIINTNNFIITI